MSGLTLICWGVTVGSSAELPSACLDGWIEASSFSEPSPGRLFDALPATTYQQYVKFCAPKALFLNLFHIVLLCDLQKMSKPFPLPKKCYFDLQVLRSSVIAGGKCAKFEPAT
jgi:hypothetical protein